MKQQPKQIGPYKAGILQKMQSAVIRGVLEIPILGALFIIINAWVLDNPSDYTTKIASPWCYTKKMLVPIVFSAVLTYGIFYFFYFSECKDVCTIIFVDMNLQIFSSLLGFGLAIFLIIFTLSSDSILKMMGSIDDAKLLCVQFSYPMVIWSANLLISAFLKFLIASSSSSVAYKSGLFAFFLMIYSFILLFSMLSSVFFAGMIKIGAENR